MDAKTGERITVAYVDRIVDAFNRHDVDAIIDFFAEDGEWFLARGPEPHGRRLKGKAQIRDLLAKRYEHMPDMRWTNGKSWVSGNVAMSTWTVQGTASDGEAINYWGIDYWEFDRNGKIVKKDTYWKQYQATDPDLDH